MTTIQHARLWLNQEDWSDRTIHALTINGGRSNPFAAADVATVGVTINFWGRPLPIIGDRVDIAGWLPGQTTYMPLFSGNVTDVAYEPAAGVNGEAVVSLTAADMMRALDGLPLGEEPWTNQYWSDRMDAIWELARDGLRDPSWMAGPTTRPNSILYAYYPHGQTGPPEAPFMLAVLRDRDIDSQPALALLREYMTQIGHALYMIPGPRSPLTDQPPWPGAGVGYTNLFNLDPAPAGRIPASVIVAADPTPRYWVNLSTTAHKVVVRAFRRPDLEYVGAEFYAQGGFPARFGYKVRSISTDMVDEDTPPEGFTTPQELANFWLWRVQWPAYMVDLTLSLHPGHPDAAAVWDAVTVNGPAQCGVRVDVEGVTGTTEAARSGDYEWVIEATEYELTADGWDVRLTLAPATVYAGTLPIPPTAADTYQDVLAWHPTYTELLGAHPTYTDLLETRHPHPAGV